MKNYSDLLRDPRWSSFREEYIEYRRGHEGELQCDDCGADTLTPLHVHHRNYQFSLAPWEYDFVDLRLLCRDCHDFLHQTEGEWRRFLLNLPPHVCYEAQDLLSALKELDDPSAIKNALARARSTVKATYSLIRRS